MRYADVSGGKLAYEYVGSGAPVVLVSGLGGNASFWDPTARALASSFSVLTYDHRGAGCSAMSPIKYSLSQMANDTVTLMDALGIERAHIVGHSLGGSIAQVIGLDHPERVRSIVISSSVAFADNYLRRVFAIRSRILQDSGVEAYIRSATIFLYPCEYIDQNYDALVASENLTIAKAPASEIILSKIDAILQFDRTHELARIKCPVLVNCAVDDIITPLYCSKRIHMEIGVASIDVFDQGGHFTPLTIPDLYLRSVNEFLKSAESGIV